MKTVKIFCFVATSGSGKSFYIDKLREDKNFVSKNNISFLVYGTTREIRENEINGKDYFFFTENEYNAIPKEEIIESREYIMAGNNKVHYFTKPEYFGNSNIIICSASPNQYANYKKWINKFNSENQEIQYNLYMIRIETSVKTRVLRSLNRATNDKMIYEVCRRVTEEQSEFKSASESVSELDLYIPAESWQNCINEYTILHGNVLLINNDSEEKNDILTNVVYIQRFITNI